MAISAQQQALTSYLSTVAIGTLISTADLAALALPSMCYRACNWGNASFWPYKAAQAAGRKCYLRKAGLYVAAYDGTVANKPAPAPAPQSAYPVIPDWLATRRAEAAADEARNALAARRAALWANLQDQIA